MPTLTVPTKYVNKLKELGVYDQWETNVQKECNQREIVVSNWTTDTLQPIIYISKSFHIFMVRSFIWSSTAEGHEFWKDIAQK